MAAAVDELIARKIYAHAYNARETNSPATNALAC
jgi:hypothetical protein